MNRTVLFGRKTRRFAESSGADLDDVTACHAHYLDF
jgi:hypothetical protein